MTDDGYSVNMRQDERTGEYLAIIPSAYKNRYGERYYMGVGESDGCWAELSPAYVTRHTRTVGHYPETLKRDMDRRMGYALNLTPRLYG